MSKKMMKYFVSFISKGGRYDTITVEGDRIDHMDKVKKIAKVIRKGTGLRKVKVLRCIPRQLGDEADR